MTVIAHIEYYYYYLRTIPIHSLSTEDIVAFSFNGPVVLAYCLAVPVLQVAVRRLFNRPQARY